MCFNRKGNVEIRLSHLRRIGVGLYALLFVLLAAPQAGAQSQIGYVVEMEGKWMLNSSSPLFKGQRLPPRGVISIDSPATYDYIKVLGLDGKVIARRDCADAGGCSKPIKLPNNPKSDTSMWGAILDSAMRLILGEPDRYSIHRSRGEEELPEAVVELKDGQFDLAPVLKEKQAGTYYVRLRALACGGRAGTRKWMASRAVDWKPARAAFITIPEIQPGLYELSVSEQDSKSYAAVAVGAWILISTPRDFQANAASFKKASKLAGKWGKDVTPEGAGSFLRAHLDSLANCAAK